MAGTPHGRHSIQLNTGNAYNNGQGLYVSLYNGLEALKTLGLIQRVALFYGNTATGMDFYDGANPAKTGSFAVYKFPISAQRPTWEWYFILQFIYGFSLTGNGTPYKIISGGGNSGGNIAIATAVAFTSGGATTSPWGGTTNNDGTDSKSDPVWAKPSGGSLYCWPRSNDVDGAHDPIYDPVNGKRQNMCRVLEDTSTTTTAHRLHLLADNDCLAIFQDTNDDASYQYFAVCAPYSVLNGLTIPAPLAMLSGGSSLSNGAVYGTQAGNSATGEGGAVDSYNGRCSSVEIDTRANMLSATYQPNNQYSTTTYMESQLGVYQAETRRGLLGFLDPFVCVSYTAAVHATLNTYSRVVLGVAGTTKTTLPWDGVTSDPGAGTSRNGTDF